MAGAVTTPTVRGRRQALGISRLTLAVAAGISTTWLAEIEAGQRPHGTALARVLAELDRLEAEREALGDAWELTPHIGRSGYRSDTRGPEAAA